MRYFCSIFLTEADSNKLHSWFLRNRHCQAAIKVNNVLFDSSSNYLDADYFQIPVISSTIQKCWSLLLVVFQVFWMMFQWIVVTHFNRVISWTCNLDFRKALHRCQKHMFIWFIYVWGEKASLEPLSQPEGLSFLIPPLHPCGPCGPFG